MQETSQKCSKYTNQKEKPNIYFFINFKHVKISQNSQKYIKKPIGIFRNFHKKDKAHRGSDSKNRGAYSKNSRKN